MKDQTGEIIIYKDTEGKETVEVTLANDTLWLSLNQISSLFQRDKSVISRHLRNIFQEEELIKEQAVAFFATTATDDKTYQVEYFNLDAIISIGYRVNSKRGTHFRKWASKVLKDHLVKGYSINEQKITSKQIEELQSVIGLLSKTLTSRALVNDIGVEVIEIVNKYAKTWELLLRYDEDRLKPEKRADSIISLDYHESKTAINALKKNLIAKNEASELFGSENNNNLSSILGNIAQTFDSIPIYASNLERAANLLYFIIKDHPFTDGNKRIACLLFLIYLNKISCNTSVDTNSLVAIALLIAESAPSQKDIMVKLIISMLE